MKLNQKILPLGLSAVITGGALIVFLAAKEQSAWFKKAQATLPAGISQGSVPPEPPDAATPPQSPQPPAPQPQSAAPAPAPSSTPETVAITSSAGTDPGSPIKTQDSFSLTCRVSPAAPCSVSLRRTSDGAVVNLEQKTSPNGNVSWTLRGSDLGGGGWTAEARAGNRAASVTIYVESKVQAL